MYKSPNIEFKIGEDIGCYWPSHFYMFGRIIEIGKDNIKILKTGGNYEHFKNDTEVSWSTKSDSESEFYTPEELKIKLL